MTALPFHDKRKLQNPLQCVLKTAECDGVVDCLDGSDENMCRFRPDYTARSPRGQIVSFTKEGKFKLTAINIISTGSSVPSETARLQCPHTHFQCPNDRLCLPVFVICNGVWDCPGKEDEDGCEEYRCPGYYRCRSSRVCLHPGYVCDGMAHCPERDDELLCGLNCSVGCTCYGLAFFCKTVFSAGDYPQLRYLSAVGSGMTPAPLIDNSMLVYLSLARCQLVSLHLPRLPNLLSLDLSLNSIKYMNVETLIAADSLRVLILSDNPLTTFLARANGSDVTLSHLTYLELSGIPLREFDPCLGGVFPNLQTLNLSDTGLSDAGEGFSQYQQLREVDLRGCPLTSVPPAMFQGLGQLQTVYGDNYKLCCKETLPAGFNLDQCFSPSDEISSCGDLLHSDAYRVVLSIMAAVSITGNLASFVFRVFLLQISSNSGFGALVTHLCAADLFMGIYLAIIGMADRMYLDSYVWKDMIWRHGSACQLAGFLCLLSSEVSAWIICVITLDRFLVLRFPFSRIRLKRGSAHLTCCLLWIGGALIAGVPLLPVTQHWQFYSQTAVCIPLPVTRQTFAGHQYSFGVIIVLNFFLFVLIAAGQVCVYLSVQANRMTATDSSKQAQDVRVARRLITIALSDFMCWFPIGLLGLLASGGYPIPGEVNVVLVILVLPLNAALNPFLYTVNTLLERRQREKERQLLIYLTKHGADAETDK